jgi:cell division protein ZapA
MNMGNKVKVKIYGQEYTITGDKSEEQIIKIAEYVNSKMHEIERYVVSGQISNVAVLAAVNVADDYFNMKNSILELKKEKERLEKDVSHFQKMWEDAKRNFLQYKEDAQSASQNKDKLKTMLDEKEKKIEALTKQLEEAGKNAKKEGVAEIKKLEEKIKDVEHNYFDLQMENVQLKSELERQKR